MDKYTKLKNIFDAYVDEGKLPGYLILITRHGEEEDFLSYGLMDIERNKPIQRDTIFRIHSMTKPITSVALMMLYEKGLFQLNDPVEKYIPSWKNLKVYGQESQTLTHPVTIKHLLTHTSGLTYDFFHKHPVDKLYRENNIRAYDVDYDLEGLVKRLAEIPLQFTPGEKWNYSIATDILGFLIEHFSGEKLNDFFQNHIFTPLEMQDTGFFVPDENASRLSALYDYSFKTKTNTLFDDPLTSRFLAPPKLLSGGGGLVSTIDDYNKFTQMLLSMGPPLLKESTVKLMTSNQLDEGKDLASMGQPNFNGMPYSGIGFGLGFSVTIDPTATNLNCHPGEYAWGGSASTTFFNDPEEELSVILMTQLYPSWTYPLRQELINYT